MWQRKFEQYASDAFTIVGLALDAEGPAPAKIYYDKYSVTFPSLVDPDYATNFGAVPKTFFIDEHGVVMSPRSWENKLKQLPGPKPVTDSVREQWTAPQRRLENEQVASLARKHAADPSNLRIASQLASRYLALGLRDQAAEMLEQTARGYDVKQIARRGGDDSKLLGQVYFQWMRAAGEQTSKRIELATLSYYLNPTVGFAKQIARLIDPTKFDHRKGGKLDDTFREGTYQRLRRQRREWLAD